MSEINEVVHSVQVPQRPEPQPPNPYYTVRWSFDHPSEVQLILQNKSQLCWFQNSKEGHLSVPLWMWLECGDDCSFVSISNQWPPASLIEPTKNLTRPMWSLLGHGECQLRSDLPREPTAAQKSPECTIEKHHQGNHHSLSRMGVDLFMLIHPFIRVNTF